MKKSPGMNSATLLPEGWNSRQAGDRVMAGLVNICLPEVRGAHDSDFIILDGKAYIVYMANDIQPGESPGWPFVYNALSIVEAATGRVEKTVTFASSGKKYANETLPPGACFVPRILRKDERTLRCFFTSEQPGARESQVWLLDYDLARGTFDDSIYRAKIKTALGVFPMQPGHFYRQAAASGFARPQTDCCLFLIDSFKKIGGRYHAVLNNFRCGLNAWAVLDEELGQFTVLGNYFEPQEAFLSESAVIRLPDGTLCAISRRENGDRNYMFSKSPDGIRWSPHEHWACVTCGTNSKATFDLFHGVYYMGWQETARVRGVPRSVFNVDVSRDGLSWERKYRFETDQSFQYPVFREYEGNIYLTVTQGSKERIMFGRLE